MLRRRPISNSLLCPVAPHHQRCHHYRQHQSQGLHHQHGRHRLLNQHRPPGLCRQPPLPLPSPLDSPSMASSLPNSPTPPLQATLPASSPKPSPTLLASPLEPSQLPSPASAQQFQAPSTPPPINILLTSWWKVLCHKCHKDSHDISYRHCIECHFKENGDPSYYHDM